MGLRAADSPCGGRGREFPVIPRPRTSKRLVIHEPAPSYMENCYHAKILLGQTAKVRNKTALSDVVPTSSLHL